MCLIGALPWVRGALLFVTQILGGITAAALVSCMFPGELNVRTTLGGGTTIVQGLFIEMFLTAQLVFTIFMLAAEKHKGTFIAPVGMYCPSKNLLRLTMLGIGLSLFIAELSGVYFTGGSLNPARTFGPNVVLHEFVGYTWIYWLGPILGSVVAAGFYKFIKVLEYETANPGQDMDHAAVVDRRKNLLLAAGINEVDATKVAQELSEKEQVGHAGGPNGNVVANGQGRSSQEDPRAMYGASFRQPSAKSMQGKRGSDDSDKAILQPHRPGYSATGSQIGRFSYLGERGISNGVANTQALANNERRDSPAMATNEQLYSSLVHGRDESLGSGVPGGVPDGEARQRIGRTPSSYA